MKKRYLAGLLTIVMAASLVACGGKSKEIKPSDGLIEDQEEIVNTVVVAMGGGFTTMDPGYIYENIQKTRHLCINYCINALFWLRRRDLRL